MKISSVPHFVIGALIAFLLLVFVNKFELFGFSCYYVGTFSLNGTCLAPGVYYGAWAIAAGFVLFGLFRADRNNKPESPSQ